MKNPLVTVIIPVFNASGTVLRAIFSIVNQTYSNLEIIIVDDGSNDDSLSVVKTVADCRLVIIALAENTRKIGAVNEALKCCKGDFITFQDADDFSYPERIQKQVDALLCSVNIGLCFTGYDFSGRNGDFLKLNSSDEEIRNEICFGGFLNHGQTYPTVCATMMFKRDLLSRVDGYRDFMIGRMGEDILLCSELMSYTEAMTIGDVLYYYDMGSANSFTDLFSKNKNPRLNSSFYLLEKIVRYNHSSDIKFHQLTLNERLNMEIFFLEEIVTDMVLLNKKLHSNYQNSIRFKIGNVMLFPFSQFIEKLRYRSAKVKFKKNESAKN